MASGSRVLALLVLVALAATAPLAQDHRKPGPHPASQSLENPAEPNEASQRAGRQIYRRHCVSCHGLDGKGRTDLAASLPAPPPDFTDGDWKYGGSDGEIYSLIQSGTPLGMEPYRELVPEQRLWDLVNYLKSFSAQADEQLSLDAVPENPIEYTTASVIRGRTLFENHCALCHGTDGSGYTDYLEFLMVPPADLRTGNYRYGNRDGDLFTVIRDGTENGMEAFERRLSEGDMWHTVNYIRRLAGR